MLKMKDELQMWELTNAFMQIQTAEIEILTRQELTMINPKHRKRRKKNE